MDVILIGSGERFQNNAVSCPEALVSCGRKVDLCKNVCGFKNIRCGRSLSLA